MTIGRSHMIHLDVRKHDCTVEVWLNDIPALRIELDAERFVSAPIHSYLIDGINHLEVVVAPGKSPTKSRLAPTAREPQAGAHCAVSLTRYETDEFVGEGGQPLLSIVWPHGEKRSEEFPLSLRASGDLGPLFGPCCWQTARILHPVNDAARIRQTIAGLHEAFRTGDSATIASLCDFYLKDEARAYPMWSLEKLRGRLVRSVEKNATPGTRIAPLVPAEFDLRLCAGSRLVECVDLHWNPLLRANGPDEKRRYPLPMFLGDVGGRLQILR